MQRSVIKVATKRRDEERRPLKQEDLRYVGRSNKRIPYHPQDLGDGAGDHPYRRGHGLYAGPYHLAPSPRSYLRPKLLLPRYGRAEGCIRCITGVGHLVPYLRAACRAQDLSRLEDEGGGYVPVNRLLDGLVVAAHQHARPQRPRRPARATLHPPPFARALDNQRGCVGLLLHFCGAPTGQEAYSSEINEGW